MASFGIEKKVRGVARRVLLPLRKFRPLAKQFYLLDHVAPEKVGNLPATIQNLRILIPERKVQIASPSEDPFVRVGKYYREGSFVQPDIFVCDIPEAVLHVGSGLVCTRDFKALPDFEYRLPYYIPFGKRKPRNIKRLAGIYSAVSCCFAWNIGHWWIDCLPRVHSLAKAEPKEKVTILMHESLGAVHKESLEYILPANISVRYFPDHLWLRLEKCIWPSVVSGRCNYLIPTEYYEAMRQPIFSRFGLSGHHHKTARIYITRRRAKHRRVLNEAAVCGLIARYGFETVDLENLNFRQQVELFHRADLVIGPHGAGLNTIMFSGNIRVIVLYPTQVPQNYFHTLAKGLGQEHHFILHLGGEDDDFTVNTEALERLLQDELGLRPYR